MIYEFYCDECDAEFTRAIPIADRNKPLDEPCPECKRKGCVRRSFVGTSISGDIMDVSTRARKVAGEGWTEQLKRIHRAAGKNSRINV